jgi:hypothetical protein
MRDICIPRHGSNETEIEFRTGSYKTSNHSNLSVLLNQSKLNDDLVLSSSSCLLQFRGCLFRQCRI